MPSASASSARMRSSSRVSRSVIATWARYQGGITCSSRFAPGESRASPLARRRFPRGSRPATRRRGRRALPGGARSGAVCPNLLQRPGSNRSAGGESLIFRASSRGRSRRGAPLQQIWTTARPGPPQEPHPHHPAKGPAPGTRPPWRARRFPVERAPPACAFDWKPARSWRSGVRPASLSRLVMRQWPPKTTQDSRVIRRMRIIRRPRATLPPVPVRSGGAGGAAGREDRVRTGRP